MTASAARKTWTIDEFLAWEEEQPGRHEFFYGRVRSMVGGTLNHSRFAMNVAVQLTARTKASCSVFVEGVKVQTSSAIAYPDVVAFCGPVRGSDRFLTDASLIAEVLSRSTASFDHGWKWLAYQTLPSLRAYLLVEQDLRRAFLYTPAGAPGRWDYRIIEDAEGSAPLGEPFGTLAFDTIYEGTSLARSA